MDVPGPDGFVPTVNAYELGLVERAAIDDLGMSSGALLERAASVVARVARERFLEGDPRGKRILVLAGPGRKGACGLIAARVLTGWGAAVGVMVAGTPDPEGPAAAAAYALSQLGVPIGGGVEVLPARPPWLVIEALVGGGLVGPLRDEARAYVTWTRAMYGPILAIDVPAGLDPLTGMAHDPTVMAHATVAFTLPKTGLAAIRARKYTGEVYLADLLPPQLLDVAGVQVEALFARSDILRLW